MVRELNSSIVLDLGTTSIKAAIVDKNCHIATLFSQAAPEIKIDGVKYFSDAQDYLNTTIQLIKKCLQMTTENQVVGLCSQRSSFLIWDKTSGLPVSPLISWQDQRGIQSCKELQSKAAKIQSLTGLYLTPYYFAAKLRTMLLDQPQWRNKLIKGDYLVGTLDSFLIWHWTSGKYHQTDVSMAARTLLMDINTLQWSQTLCDLFSIPLQILPEIMPSYGFSLPLTFGPTLKTSLADQSAALVASVSAAKGSEEALVNLGTGGFVIRYIENDTEKNSAGYLTSLVMQQYQSPPLIALEGTLNSITAALSAYPFQECVLKHLAEFPNIFCIAEPSGIGAPFFREDIGLTFSESILHLSQQQQAALLLESIIFRVTLILQDFQQQSSFQRVYLAGGLSELSCLQQGIALCCGAEVYKLRQKESSLQGTALLLTENFPNLSRETIKIQTPDETSPALKEKYQRWKIWFEALLN